MSSVDDLRTSSNEDRQKEIVDTLAAPSPS
jgi:hypothetical protein